MSFYWKITNHHVCSVFHLFPLHHSHSATWGSRWCVGWPSLALLRCPPLVAQVSWLITPIMHGWLLLQSYRSLLWRGRGSG